MRIKDKSCKFKCLKLYGTSIFPWKNFHRPRKPYLITLWGWGPGLLLPGPFSHLHLLCIKKRVARFVTNYTGYIFLQVEDVRNMYENNLDEHFCVWRTLQVKQLYPLLYVDDYQWTRNSSFVLPPAIHSSKYTLFKVRSKV